MFVRSEESCTSAGVSEALTNSKSVIKSKLTEECQND